MNIPVTRTKCIVPRRRPELLSRPRLVDLLSELLDNRLTIIAAPAGYGKTSLLVDAASQTSLPFCWYTIDALDRDFKRFLTYFIASIHQAFPEFGKQSLILLQEMSQIDQNLDQLVTSLVNEAYDTIREHFVIVLDDYHFVDNHPQINQFIDHFIQEVDENCHIVITSRNLLTLPDLPLMVARAQVGGLGFDDLAFQAEEIRTLIQKNYQVTISDSAAENLAQQTEGWITGLLLSTQLQWQGLNDRLRLSRVSTTASLYDYLAQQVLDQQLPEVRNFLLKTSVMDEFDADLCEAVFGPPAPGEPGWGDLMNLVLRNNLFVLPIGEKGLWLRYHHLFRDFLHDVLCKENPALEKQIVKNLADIYAQKADWERAYVLYQRLGRNQDLVALIEKSGADLLKTGRINTLANWIDALDLSLVDTSSTLLSLRGSVAVMLGDVDRGLSLLNQCETVCRKNGDLRELARVLTRQAHTHLFKGNYPLALQEANEALEISRQEFLSSEPEYEAAALRCRGLALYRLGKISASIQDLNQAVTLYDSMGNLENVTVIQIELGVVYRGIGDYYFAQEAYERALARLSKIGDLAHQAAVQNNLGFLFFTLGHYEKAAGYFEQAIANAKQSGYSRVEAEALFNMGDLYKELNAPEAAANAYQQAESIAKKIDDAFLDFYYLLSTASILSIQEDFAAAEDLLNKADELAAASNSPYQKGLLLLHRGQLYFKEKNFSTALTYLDQAQAIFNEQHQISEQIQSAAYLSQVYLETDQEEKAIQTLWKAFELLSSDQQQDILIPITREAKGVLQAAAKWTDTRLKAELLLNQIHQFEKLLFNLRRRLRKQVLAVPFSPPKISIRGLGRNQVLVDGKPVTNMQWQAQVARDLLFLLLTYPEGLTKETIAEIFWPESTPAQVKLQFKNTIYRVRHALDQEVILLDDDRYRFNQELDYEYDVELFESRILQAQNADNIAKQISQYKAGLSLYKGDFLPEVEGDWVTLEREKLHQTYIHATHQLIELYIQVQDYPAGLKLCQEVLSKDPCLEDAHRLAMKIHAAMGNKAGIVRQYERCEETLRKEVNLPPSKMTRDLYQALIQ